MNTTDFDRRLNDWFDSVDPKQVPPRIVFQALSQVADTGQIRGPLQRFAATIELAWRPRPALTSGIALVIITGLLIVALAAGVASGLIRLPSPPHVIDGLIAVQDAVDNPDTSAAGDQQIRFIDPKTGNDVGGTDHDASACAAHFSPDGSRYVLLYQDPDQIGTGVVNIGVANADPQDFQPSFLFRKEVQGWFAPSWAPDGSAIVTTIEPVSSDENGNPGGRLWVLPTDGSAARMLTEVPTGNSSSWSATGRWIAFVGKGPEHSLYVIRPDGTDLRKLRDSGTGSVAWSSTKDELAYMGSGRLHVVNPDGVELAAIPYSPSPPDQSLGVVTPAWSPDGTRIALTYGGLKVIDVSSGALSSIATSVQGGPVDWSADGQRLVATDKNGNLLEIYLDGSPERLIASHVRGMCMSASRALSWQKVTE